MTETADVIVVGAGVQGASLAFHLARRGASVLVLERESVAAGATGRSSGFVRMHYDLESEARLAWASFPYFHAWQEDGRSRRLRLRADGLPAAHARGPGGQPARQRRDAAGASASRPDVVEPAEIARLVPGS